MVDLASACYICESKTPDCIPFRLRPHPSSVTPSSTLNLDETGSHLYGSSFLCSPLKLDLWIVQEVGPRSNKRSFHFLTLLSSFGSHPNNLMANALAEGSTTGVMVISSLFKNHGEFRYYLFCCLPLLSHLLCSDP